MLAFGKVYPSIPMAFVPELTRLASWRHQGEASGNFVLLCPRCNRAYANDTADSILSNEVRVILGTVDSLQVAERNGKTL